MNTVPSNISKLIGELDADLKNVASFDAQIAVASAEDAALKREWSSEVLAKNRNMEAVRKLATSTATIAVLQDARANAETFAREKALPIAVEVHRVYPRLRAVLAKNTARAKELVAGRIGSHFDDATNLELAVCRSTLVQKAQWAEQVCPLGSTGFSPAEISLPAEVSVERVIREARAVDVALLAADKFAEELR